MKKLSTIVLACTIFGALTSCSQKAVGTVTNATKKNEMADKAAEHHHDHFHHTSITKPYDTSMEKLNTDGEQGIFLAPEDLEWVTAFDGFPIKFSMVSGSTHETPHGTFGRFPGVKEFGQDFVTPSHIHGHSYQAVVVSGTMINPMGDEDPKNAKKMGPGSYWYVPANEVHSTGCISDEPCVFYMYQPVAFNFIPKSPEEQKMLNTTEPTLNTNGNEGIFLAQDEIEWVNAFEGFPIKFGMVSGSTHETPHGTFGKFPGVKEFGQDFVTPSHIHGHSYQAVVISGTMINPMGNEDPKNAKKMGPGSYWYVPADEVHSTGCISDEPCVFYMYQPVAFNFVPKTVEEQKGEMKK